ncbi:MAG: DUF5009 domain-containing protein [Candidatus Hydrogenedens sp.]|nr:DUF5009 domain-containing protein [Candidatus Hydrogenedens sp.]
MAQSELDTVAAESTSGRMISVDTLRGFDMFWIVGGEDLVHALGTANGERNSGVLHFFVTQLTHKQWEGFAFYDLIFPLFLFLVGLSTVFSLGRIQREEGTAAAHKRLFKRSAILYAIGIFYYGLFANAWPGIRLVGVLQRLALGYLFGGLLFLNLKLRGLIAAFVAILIAYWAIMTFIPAPGQEVVSFAPDQNIANYIDLHYLPGRLNDGTWDPEGILSTLPAIGTALLGVFAGLLLKNKNIADIRKVGILIGGGALLVALGFLWGLQFPVIKKLWTSSYVLVAGGYSCMLLGAFYYVVDVLKSRWWTPPFIWIGSNALAIYLAWNVFEFGDLAERFVGGDIAAAFGNYGETLIVAVSLLLVVAFARLLFKREIFLRV